MHVKVNKIVFDYQEKKIPNKIPYSTPKKYINCYEGGIKSAINWPARSFHTDVHECS